MSIMKKNSSIIYALALLAIISIFASCNKLSKATESGASLPVTPDSVILKSHVIVIDSTQLTLVSSDAQISQGIYAYTSNSALPGFIANDIIIGITGAGYLRKVTSVMSQQNGIVLNTVQARLEDVFLQANINFSSNISNFPGATSNGYQYNIGNALIFQDALATAKIMSGTISINPNWNYNIQFQNGTMTGFSAVCRGGTLNSSLQMNISSSASDNINTTTTLNTVSGRTIVWIGQLPIVITTDLSYTANISGTVTGSTSRTVSITNNDTYTLGDTYSSGAWQSQYNFTNNSTINGVVPAAAVMNISCRIMPQMNIMIYGVACPVASVSISTSELGNISTTSADWDFSAGLSQQPSFNVSGAILGYAVPDNFNNWNTDTVNYLTPYRVIMVSGDGQIGAAYEYLPQPLMVQVLDNNGNGQGNVPVYYSVTSGEGSLSNSTLMSVSGGYSQDNWLLGNPATASQNVQVKVKNASGNQVNGSPLSFIAL